MAMQQNQIEEPFSLGKGLRTALALSALRAGLTIPGFFGTLLLDLGIDWRNSVGGWTMKDLALVCEHFGWELIDIVTEAERFEAENPLVHTEGELLTTTTGVDDAPFWAETTSDWVAESEGGKSRYAQLEQGIFRLSQTQELTGSGHLSTGPLSIFCEVEQWRGDAAELAADMRTESANAAAMAEVLERIATEQAGDPWLRVEGNDF